MKWMFSIMAAWFIGIAGIGAAVGFELPKVTPDKGAPYRFGHHYDYDNAGSSWNHEMVYRHPEHRHDYSRWYYHYGYQPKPYTKQRSYPFKKDSYSSDKMYGDSPGLGYSRHKAHIYRQHQSTPKGDTHRKFIQLRDRIPNHSFRHTRSFNRVRIGR
jgi:hypothetical protein